MYIPFPDRAPPEAGVRTCAQLKLWVREARRNDLVRYASGPILVQACTPELREYVMALAELHYLTPHVMTGPDGARLYVCQRTAKNVVEGQL